jgi:hypothetical protein
MTFLGTFWTEAEVDGGLSSRGEDSRKNFGEKDILIDTAYCGSFDNDK